MKDERLRLLQIGDVAGVATDLTRALEEDTEWTVDNLGVPELAAGSNIVLRSLAWPLRATETWWSVHRRLRASPPTLVHLHWARYAPLVTTGDLPLVVHAHGSDVRDRRSSLSGRLVSRALRRSALVIASTPDLIDDLPAGAVYLPNPIDVETFRPDQPLGSDPRRVLIFAQLTAIKGADVILDAVRTIRQHQPDVSVVSFGGSPRYESIARELGVSLLPRMERTSLARELSRASIVIGQQRIGSLGLSELEAMACERPVLARVDIGRYPAAPPIVSTLGAADLAAACIDLLEDAPASAAMGSAARKYVLEHHAPSAVARTLDRLYRSVLTTA